MLSQAHIDEDNPMHLPPADVAGAIWDNQKNRFFEMPAPEAAK